MPGYVYMTLGSKGGPGKSFCATLLHANLKRLNFKIAAYDLDADNGSFYASSPLEITLSSIDAKNGWLDACFSEAFDHVIVDVPGGRISELASTLDAGIPALQEAVNSANKEIVVVQPIGTMRDSTLAAQAVLEVFSGSKIVIVKNGYFGKPEDFVIFDGIVDQYGAKKYGKTGELARAAGAQVLYLPKLSAQTAAVLDIEEVRLIDAGGCAAKLGYRHALNASSYLIAISEAFKGTWLSPIPARQGAV
jgi:hypothetical protein